MLVMRRPANVPVVSVNHHQAGLTERFRMDGLAESTRAFQCWFQLRQLTTIAEADQFRSVVQVAYDIEDTGTLDRNQSHGLDLRGIRDVEDSKPCTVLLFNVEIGIAIRSPTGRATALESGPSPEDPLVRQRSDSRSAI